MESKASVQRKVRGLACSVILILLSAACQHEHAGVSILQVGTEGSGEAFVGQELPIAAHVSVHAPIERADVKIRPVSNQGWTLAQRYTKGFEGNTHNYRFEASVGIPDTVEPGDYTLILLITDATESVSEDSVRFRLTIDSTIPTASDLDVGINAAGDDLHLETELSAPLGIAKVVVEVKGDRWKKTFSFSGGELVGRPTHRFHEHVKIGEAPKGSYNVRLVVEDSKGRKFRTEGAFVK